MLMTSLDKTCLRAITCNPTQFSAYEQSFACGTWQCSEISSLGTFCMSHMCNCKQQIHQSHVCASIFLQAEMQMARSASDSGQALQHPMSPGSVFREELRAAERDLQEQSALLSPRAGSEGSEPSSPSASSSRRPPLEERQRRRMTYPAGRIYHLVPARLVFGTPFASEVSSLQWNPSMIVFSMGTSCWLLRYRFGCLMMDEELKTMPQWFMTQW